MFFSGKPLTDNVEAWRDIYRHLSRYFARLLFLNRNGAAVIAIEALLQKLGETPDEIRLLEYTNGWLASKEEDEEQNLEVADPPAPEISLSNVEHFFRIEADGRMYVIRVVGIKAEFDEID